MNLFSKENVRSILHKYHRMDQAEGWEDRAAEEFCNFTDKASYLEWVSEWKKSWKELSKEQTEIRIQLSKPHDSLGFVESEGGWRWPRAAFLQSKKGTNRYRLHILMAIRRVGKKKSWQMKQESKS